MPSEAIQDLQAINQMFAQAFAPISNYGAMRLQMAENERARQQQLANQLAVSEAYGQNQRALQEQVAENQRRTALMAEARGMGVDLYDEQGKLKSDAKIQAETRKATEEMVNAVLDRQEAQMEGLDRQIQDVADRMKAEMLRGISDADVGKIGQAMAVNPGVYKLLETDEHKLLASGQAKRADIDRIFGRIRKSFIGYIPGFTEGGAMEKATAFISAFQSASAGYLKEREPERSAAVNVLFEQFRDLTDTRRQLQLKQEDMLSRNPALLRAMGKRRAQTQTPGIAASEAEEGEALSRFSTAAPGGALSPAEQARRTIEAGKRSAPAPAARTETQTVTGMLPAISSAVGQVAAPLADLVPLGAMVQSVPVALMGGQDVRVAPQTLTGPQRAAQAMMALGDTAGANPWDAGRFGNVPILPTAAQTGGSGGSGGSLMQMINRFGRSGPQLSAAAVPPNLEANLMPTQAVITQRPIPPELLRYGASIDDIVKMRDLARRLYGLSDNEIAQGEALVLSNNPQALFSYQSLLKQAREQSQLAPNLSP